MYDLLAGGENMESSYLMSKGKALEAFSDAQRGTVWSVPWFITTDSITTPG